MKNRQYEEFAKEKFDKEKNYNAIISKIKEGSPMKKNKSTKYKILNIAAIFIIIIVVASLAPSIYAKIQWNIQFEDFKNREYETGSGTIKEAEESGYTQEIDMDYVTQDGISVKVDSLMITDDYFKANINFKFAEGIEVNSKTFDFGVAVYDEQKNVYGVSTRMHLGTKDKYDYYTLNMYKEIGVEYNKKDVYAIQLSDEKQGGVVSVDEAERNIISKVEMRSSKGFPRSKKMYIRVFDLGYFMANIDRDNPKNNVVESFTISDAEWHFEIDVPDKFYERQTIELKLKEDIPGVETEKITVTESGLVIRAKIEGLDNVVFLGKDMNGEEWIKLRNETINITDGEGNIYYENSIGTLKGKNWYKLNYSISKNTLEKRLFLNVKINGKQYSSELIQK